MTNNDTNNDEGEKFQDFQSRKGLKEQIAIFDQRSENQERILTKNPYAESYKRPEYDKKSDERYGRPEQGSKTERRGISAGNYVCREVQFLCETIYKFGTATVNPNLVEIKFGYLFEIYSHYSDKLVGMLIRARKYKLLDFEGEMLYQRQDDHKMIKMLKTMDEIRETIKESGDPAQFCISQQQDCLQVTVADDRPMPGMKLCDAKSDVSKMLMELFSKLQKITVSS